MRCNPARNCLKISSGSKWTLNNNQVVSSRLNVHKVITVLTSNQICHNGFFRWKVPVNADSRSSRILIVRKKSTKESKSRSQHLKSLKKVVLSMYFLETNNVVVVQESFQILELEFSIPLSEENRSNETPGVPSNTSQAFGKEGTTPIPPCRTL